MHCPECHQFLQDYFDGEAGDAAALHQHLTNCPGCRELHSAARRLEDGLHALVPPLPPVGLADQIVVRVLRDKRAALRLRRQLIAAAAIAASLSVLALLGYQRWSLRDAHPEQPVPVVTLSPPIEPSPAAPSLRDEVAEARTAGVAVARRVQEETVQPIRMLWPDPMPTPSLPGAEVLQQTVDPAAQGVRQLTHGVAVVGEPVANGFRRWGDLMLRHLPADETDRKPGL